MLRLLSSSKHVLFAAVLIAAGPPCESAGIYTLAYWRQWAGGFPPENAGNAHIRAFVFNEQGSPVPNVRVRYQWSGGETYEVTDERGYVERGFQFTGNPCRVRCEDNVPTPLSTSDWTPYFWNHDSHRVYEVGFLYQDGAFHFDPPDAGVFDLGIFDLRWHSPPAPDPLLDPTKCPSTFSLMYNTPDPENYNSGSCAENLGSGVYEFGQTFRAEYNRAMAFRANITKDPSITGERSFRWAGQICEGGPNGPPMGPKKLLPFCANSNDLKYFLCYKPEECALMPGQTYYVSFTSADGGPIDAWELFSDVYPYGTLHRNGSPVGGDLQAYVCGESSTVTDVGTITGTVTGPDGEPINEAAVEVAPSGRRVMTGRLGSYKCYNIAAGTYSMTASAPGYQSVTLAGRAVTSSATLTTNFVLPRDPGPIRVLSTTGGVIGAGAQDVPVAMIVSSADGRDCFVTSAGHSFWQGGADRSAYFGVTASPSNPTVIRGGQTATFDFVVDCSPGLPGGAYTVQGRLDAYVNLQANGSFEADTYIPNYSGPTGWDRHSVEQPSVARLSYEHQCCYENAVAIPPDTRKIRVRWIGKWSETGTLNKKQGLRVTVPSQDGLSSRRTELDVSCGVGQYVIWIKTGTGDKQVPFLPNKYYEIDAAFLSSGACTIVVTPLEEPGRDPETITGTTTETGSLAIKWGKMYASGTEEMSCREIHYWCENAGGAVISESHWLATNGILPTAPGGGWAFDSSGNQAIIPGAPWSADSLFAVTTADKKEGARALQAWVSPSDVTHEVLLSTGRAFPGGSGLLPMMQVRPSTSYTLSFWYKQDHYTVNPAWLRVIWEEYKWDAARGKYKPYYYHDNNPDWPSPGYLMPLFHWTEPEGISHGEWRYRSYTFTTSAQAEYAEIQLRMDKPSTAATADAFWFDDVRLFEMNPYADVDADSPGTLLVPKAVASIGAAKDEPDGAAISLTCKAVTGYPVDVTSRFYIEETDRSSGIIVDKTGGAGLLDVSRNDLVTLRGVLATVGGERVLTQINVSAKSTGTAPAPLGMSCKDLGGAADGYTAGVQEGSGLNNIGLLVTVWGRVVPLGPDSFVLFDGMSGETGVRVISGSIPQPVGATHAVVTGFSSVYQYGGGNYKAVRPRDASDIVWF